MALSLIFVYILAQALVWVSYYEAADQKMLNREDMDAIAGIQYLSVGLRIDKAKRTIYIFTIPILGYKIKY